MERIPKKALMRRTLGRLWLTDRKGSLGERNLRMIAAKPPQRQATEQPIGDAGKLQIPALH
jgi:hypothetical protein